MQKTSTLSSGKRDNFGFHCFSFSKPFIIVSCFIVLFISDSFAQCNLSANMSKKQVNSILGTADWIQKGDDCWTYFNSGIECIFQKGVLYSIRYITGCPALPSNLKNAGVALNSKKKSYSGIGNLADSDVGKYLTDIYTDNSTFMYALNYSKLTNHLENVLVRQATMPIFCSNLTNGLSKEDFQKWYTIGGYVVDFLTFKTEGNVEGLQHSLSSLKTRLGEISIVNTSIPLYFQSGKLKDKPIIQAALLRDDLLALAATEGRKIGKPYPIAVFDGLFTTSISKGVGRENGFNEIAAIDEVISHFEGRNTSLYAVLDPKASTDIDQLVAILKSKDYYKRDARAVAKRIDKYIRYLKAE